MDALHSYGSLLSLFSLNLKQRKLEMFDSLLSKIHVLKLQKTESQNFLDFTFSKILVLVKSRVLKYVGFEIIKSDPRHVFF